MDERPEVTVTGRLAGFSTNITIRNYDMTPGVRGTFLHRRSHGRLGHGLSRQLARLART